MTESNAVPQSSRVRATWRWPLALSIPLTFGAVVAWHSLQPNPMSTTSLNQEAFHNFQFTRDSGYSLHVRIMPDQRLAFSASKGDGNEYWLSQEEWLQQYDSMPGRIFTDFMISSVLEEAKKLGIAPIITHLDQLSAARQIMIYPGEGLDDIFLPRKSGENLISFKAVGGLKFIRGQEQLSWVLIRNGSAFFVHDLGIGSLPRIITLQEGLLKLGEWKSLPRDGDFNAAIDKAVRNGFPASSIERIRAIYQQAQQNDHAFVPPEKTRDR